MDTSETYTKMCEKAEEIQVIWHDVNLIGILPSNKGFGLDYEKGYVGSFIAGKEIVDYEYDTSYSPQDVWLPRQDQLQGMVNINSLCTKITRFEYFYHNLYRDLFTIDTFATMEQIWLAFVMKEKFGKIWDSGKEDWVKP